MVSARWSKGRIARPSMSVLLETKAKHKGRNRGDPGADDLSGDGKS
jgi:hypothetical protein